MAIIKPRTEEPHLLPSFKRRKISIFGGFSGGSGKATLAAQKRRRVDEVFVAGARALDSRGRTREALTKYHAIRSTVVHEMETENGTKQVNWWSASCAALRILKRTQHWACWSKRIGPVPGVEIGDKFQDRAELKVVGLTLQLRRGIDYTRNADGTIFATSVVFSGRYENDVLNPGTLIYTGEGGNPSIGCKEVVDQKDEFGNRALVNSWKMRVPIRVVCRFKLVKDSELVGLSGAKLCDQMYVYDGLYFIHACTQERGKYGKLIFKFLLKRVPGQPKSDLEKFARKIETLPAPRAVACSNDISLGKEKIPIRLMKALSDGETLPSFDYITGVVYAVSSPIMESKAICCSCNGGTMAYDSKGRINIEMNSKRIIYECSPRSECPSTCLSRVTQNGISSKLEVFCSKLKRWGVRPRSYIAKGSFVCEFVGEVLPEKEVKRRYFDRLRRGNTSNSFRVFSCSDKITIDATVRGNVGRFVNHCDSPNLEARFVLYDHRDERMPHVMLFALRDIPPLHQLTMDYSFTMSRFGRY